MTKIVVVDDSKLARDLVARALAEAGHEVHPVAPTSLYEVLKVIREVLPRLVITDYNMPILNAETLVRTLREDPFLKDLLVMVLSANRDADVVSAMLQQGVDGYAFKGNQAVLVERVRALLA
jgi:CheY-like chemotaxis protein